MAGLTFDTGALIALERRRERMVKVLAAAVRARVRVTAPVAVVAEWWRASSSANDALLAALLIEPMDLSLAKLAGEAMALVRGATVVDAIVMASAARRGDVVYTSDYDDLAALQRRFRSVRVLSI